MHPTQEALDAVRALEEPHRYAHRCNDQVWWRNDQTCPVLTESAIVRASLEHLHERVHVAAHTPTTVDTVAAAMLSGPLTDLDPEQQDAWRQLTHLALERLSEVLDRDPADAARAQAAAGRLVDRG